MCQYLFSKLMMMVEEVKVVVVGAVEEEVWAASQY